MKIPSRPPAIADLVKLVEPSDFVRIVESSSPVDPKGRYLHYDDMRVRTPPDGLTLTQWWLSTSMARGSLAKPLPITATDGEPFTFCNIDFVQEAVHRIDQQASGQILADELAVDLRSSDRYLVSSLVEEAITSSQLEGASTTRRVAKELLATGRAPRDRSEQMIVNNFNAMLFAQELATHDLTPTDVLDLHRILTEDTLDDPAGAGRLQRPGDERIAVYWHDNTLLHQPPAAEELEDRLQALCDFANGTLTTGFIHPVVRAITIHFWLAYDHPFVDGNGRTARALFYWSMLHDGYWLAQYLSVSSILRKAPVQYAKSYLHTESDNNDLTYFVVYQLGVIERAIKSLYDYLARKIAETREIEALVQGSPHLNNRQLLVIGDALRDPSEPFTITAQARRNGVTYESARSDLVALERLGVLTKHKVGKKHVFRAVPNLQDRVRELAGTS